MKDYEGVDEGHEGWHVSEPWEFIMPVPTFNQPVRIRAVELRTVFSSGPFDRPDAYLLVFPGNSYYRGDHLVEQAGANHFLAGAIRVGLGSRTVHKLDNSLSIVIPLDIHQPGCHEAQIIFRVTTSDGTTRTLATRWYASLDTGGHRTQGYNECAGSRPTQQPSPTHTG